jgi:hypothetical protein
MLEADLVFFIIKIELQFKLTEFQNESTLEEIIQIYTNMGTKTVLQMSYLHLHSTTRRRKKKKHSQKSGRSES